MVSKTRIQMLVVLAIGALGGWLAASGRLSLAHRAEASPPDNSTPTKSTLSCCEGADRGVMLAKAEPREMAVHNAAVHANAQATGKKPNIMFIMGDDIGWMQPSCYHRGLMVGETPNIDRLAAEGGMFMHYYAESSCTTGRIEARRNGHPCRCQFCQSGQFSAPH